MVRAAHELFCERGYTGTRMTDVAAAAHVAVQTVYFTFHTKSELLQACYERAVLGEEDPAPPQKQPWYGAVLAAESGEEALLHFAAGYASIATRAAVLDDVIRSATHEPEAVAVRVRSEQLRREGFAVIVEHLHGRFGLRADLTITTATDLLLTLAGPAVYRQLAVDYRWEHDRYVEWLAGTLAEALLQDGADPGAEPSGGGASRGEASGREASGREASAG
jgi:AcrR family transcriptional regulator